MDRQRISVVGPSDCTILPYLTSSYVTDVCSNLSPYAVDEWQLVMVVLRNFKMGLDDRYCEQFIARLDDDMDNSLASSNDPYGPDDWGSLPKLALSYFNMRDAIVNDLYAAWYAIEEELSPYQNIGIFTDPTIQLQNVEVTSHGAIAIYTTRPRETYNHRPHSRNRSKTF